MIAMRVYPRTILKHWEQFLGCMLLVFSFGFAHSQNLDSQIQQLVESQKPNIPGVSGFGQDTKGGQGGEVIRVTNLKSKGKGSLAEALGKEGPRIVVFEVAGVIDLKGQSLAIANPYITIAGQTAPHPGITLIRGGLGINTYEVVIQHIKVRPGEAGHPKKSGWEPDGIATSQGAHHVIIDHCSVTWATDENISASGPRFEGETLEEWRQNTSHHITISHCIIASGLSQSTHAKGEHSKGTLIHDNATSILVYGNLYAHNVDRNPYCKGGSQAVVVNNYVYNPGRAVFRYGLVADEWEGHDHVDGLMSIAGNSVQYGPDSKDNIAAFSIRKEGGIIAYWKDNTIFPDTFGFIVQGSATFVTEPPVWPEGLQVHPSSMVKEWVLENAGAFPNNKDAVDQAIVDDIRSGTGKIIDSEKEAGGYPEVKPVYRKLDEAVLKELKTSG